MQHRTRCRAFCYRTACSCAVSVSAAMTDIHAVQCRLYDASKRSPCAWQHFQPSVASPVSCTWTASPRLLSCWSGWPSPSSIWTTLSRLLLAIWLSALSSERPLYCVCHNAIRDQRGWSTGDSKSGHSEEEMAILDGDNACAANERA